MEFNDDFGNWFAGIIDGEGSFILGCRHQTSTPNALVRKVGLKVQVRGDDVEMLRYIETNIGGSVTNNGSWYWLWLMQRAEQCATILVPLFDKYQLHSKKAKEYIIWREVVLRHYDLFIKRSRATPETIQLNIDFQQAVTQIKRIRDYEYQLEQARKGGESTVSFQV